jgi:hypothetical protein
MPYVSSAPILFEVLSYSRFKNRGDLAFNGESTSAFHRKDDIAKLSYGESWHSYILILGMDTYKMERKILLLTYFGNEKPQT